MISFHVIDNPLSYGESNQFKILISIFNVAHETKATNNEALLTNRCNKSAWFFNETPSFLIDICLMLKLVFLDFVISTF